MTGAWANNWWTSSYKCNWINGECGPEDDYTDNDFYCDFFCGDGKANSGSKTVKEECDVGLSLNPSEGISGTDLRNSNCQDVAGSYYTEGLLDCDSNCNFDTTNCSIPPVVGCTDSNACNYNPSAAYDDGSCNDPDTCGACSGGNTGPGPDEQCWDGSMICEGSDCPIPTKCVCFWNWADGYDGSSRCDSGCSNFCAFVYCQDYCDIINSQSSCEEACFWCDPSAESEFGSCDGGYYPGC
jgi:hypothetical protein